MPIDLGIFRIDPWLITVFAVLSIIILIFVIIWSIRAHQKRVSAGREDLVGRTAVVDIDLEPRGIVFVEGERWTAFSEAGKIKAEEEVIINRVDGLKIYVTRKENKEVRK